jgi:MFS family permease
MCSLSLLRPQYGEVATALVFLTSGHGTRSENGVAVQEKLRCEYVSEEGGARRTVATERSGLGRRFWWLWWSAAASNTGDGVTRTLLPLLVVSVSQSPLTVSGLTAVNAAPWLLFALPAGVLVDRLDRSTILRHGNTARAVLLAATAVVLLQDEPVVVLYVLAFLLGCCETLVDTAAPAMLPSLVDDRDLDRANGRLSIPQIVLNDMAGPPLAGILLGLGATVAILTGSGLYAAAAVLVAAATVRLPGPTAAPGRATVREATGQGLRFVVGQPALRLTLAASALFGLVYGAGTSLLVLFAVEDLGLHTAGYGFLLTVGAVGAIGGSWLAPRLSRRLPVVRTARVALATCGLCYVGLALVSGPVGAGALLFCNGFSTMVWNIPVMSLRQRLTPHELLGRVMSVFRLSAWGSMAVGALLAGLFAEFTSVRTVLISAGVLLAAGAMLILAPLREEPAEG